jgi:hypothetical protein
MVLALRWVFCTDLRTDSDFCFVQHKLIGFYNLGGKSLHRSTDWFLIQSRLDFVFKRLNWQELTADKPPPSCAELRMRGPILALPPGLPRHVLNNIYDNFTRTSLHMFVIFKECIVTNCTEKLVSILGKDFEAVMIYLYICVRIPAYKITTPLICYST